MFGAPLIVERSVLSEPVTQSSTLLEELASRAGHDATLAYLLQRKARPTADDYITLQWGELPDEIDDEEAQTIELLRELEKTN